MAISASLVADRLVLGDRPPALDAEFCVIERGFVGGAADAEIHGLHQNAAAPGHFIAIEQLGCFVTQKIIGRHLTILECDLAARAVTPGALMRTHGQSRSVSRHDEDAHALPLGRFDGNR